MVTSTTTTSSTPEAGSWPSTPSRCSGNPNSTSRPFLWNPLGSSLALGSALRRLDGFEMAGARPMADAGVGGDPWRLPRSRRCSTRTRSAFSGHSSGRLGRVIMMRRFVAVLGLVAVAGLVAASTASAQEASICTKWKDRLKPGDSLPPRQRQRQRHRPRLQRPHLRRGRQGPDQRRPRQRRDQGRPRQRHPLRRSRQRHDLRRPRQRQDLRRGRERQDHPRARATTRCSASEGDDRIVGYGKQRGEIVDDGDRHPRRRLQRRRDHRRRRRHAARLHARRRAQHEDP